MKAFFTYATTDSHGNKVKGHKMRCLSLAQEWHNRREVRVYNPLDADVLFCDSWHPLDMPINKHQYVVAVTDTNIVPVDSPNMIVNNNAGGNHFTLEYCLRFPDAIILTGIEYFVRRKSFENIYATHYHGIVVAPGGNIKEFNKTVDIRQIEQAASTYDTRFSYLYDIGEQEFAKSLIKANIVICPASVTALEAISLGKVVLLVQTASDQELNYRYIIESRLAYEYSYANLLNALDGRLIASKPIKANGAKKIIDVVLHGLYS